MKRSLTALAAVLLVSLGGIAVASAAGGPEIDRANATLDAKGQLAATRCAGEDGIKYVTYRGALSGGESETTPGFTDYVLSGPLHLAQVVWTINLTTKRGLLTSPVQVINTAGAPTYSGTLTLITQGLPTSGSAAPIPGRGWIVAQTFTNGQIDGGQLLANVASQLSGPPPALTLNGVFGNNPPFPATANYAITWNGQTC